MDLEQPKYLLEYDGKHALYCDGYSHLYRTCWGSGYGSFNKDSCSCNLIKKFIRRLKLKGAKLWQHQ